jgi:hypothetical protein
MTLREWFAGQALAGLLARNITYTAEHIADECYRYADAMLAKEAGGDKEKS